MGVNSFYTGLSGLKANSTSLSVIGDNLANVNTIGFKGSRVSFAELFAPGAASINGAGIPDQVGLGTTVAGVQQMFSAGALQPTEVATDMALQGNGFFIVKNGEGLPLYTRAGNFTFDNSGYLVDSNGYRVQGFTSRDANGHIIPSGTVNDINIPTGQTAPPKATSYFQTAMNLNSATDMTTATPWTNTVTVFDSLGNQHDVSLVFTPQDNNADGTLDEWSYEARVANSEIAGATPTSGYTVASSGTVTFDSNGQLTSPTADVTISLSAWSNGASAQDVTWKLFDPNTGNAVLTGYSAPSSIDSLSQDGYSMGRLTNLAVDNDGVVSGIFTNGQTIELAQVGIASFNNTGGLIKATGNAFMASIGSGPAAVGVANTGGRGTVTPKALELSNVDITDQFTDLIIAERGYQANTRVITTTDQITQEAINIKR